MNRLVNSLSSITLMLGLVAASGCAASFKLEDPPPGFIEVSSSKYDGEAELRMKAPDNVGLNITTFYNSRGGTLALWAEDMIKKLGERGYVLQRQSAVKSANGREGTRFDFSYEPPGSDDGLKFYTAVLFVTDDWQVVVQLAGKAELEADHAEDLERILGEIKIRGCKVGSKVCKAGQPRQFETKQFSKPNTAGDDKPAADQPAEPAPVEPAPAEDKPAAPGPG